MDLSLIILNFHSAGMIKYCIKSIIESQPSFEYEIIVVNNSPGDGCKEMLEKNYPSVRYIENKKNLGFGRGNNVGIAQAKGKYLVLLNNDITVLPGAIDSLVYELQTNPTIGMVGPQLLSGDRTRQHSCFRFPPFMIALYRRTSLGKTKKAQKRINEFLLSDWDHKEQQPVDWIQGSCLVTERDTLREIGCFDERFFFYVEDMDLCRRYWHAGKEVHYVPQAQMIHLHHKESASYSSLFSLVFNKTTRWHITAWCKYFIKYRGVKIPNR